MKNRDYCLENVRYIDAMHDETIYRDRIYIVDGKLRFSEEHGRDYTILNCSNHLMIPSFIQTHVHLCQHLMKGMAEDVPLFEWLGKYILPYETSHTDETMNISARLALFELINSGTTTILDMGTFSHQENIFKELKASSVRGYSGSVIMDREVGGVSNDLQSYIHDAVQYNKKYHDINNGPVFVLCPRFVPGMTEQGMSEVRKLQKDYDMLIHTHASETMDELKYSMEHFGKGNIELMRDADILNKRTVIAHVIHVSQEEKNLLAEHGAHVAHCPSANMKLGSGIADIAEMVDMGINVTLGSDGAPCNNNHSQLMEMRLAGLMQKVKHGPDRMKARDLFAMATINGAKALGIDDETGTIDEGKWADISLIALDKPSISTVYRNPFNSIIYSASDSDIAYVFSKGVMLKESGNNIVYDRGQLINERDRVLKDFLFDRF